MENVIEISNLTKNYGKQRGISHVSFSVEKGDIFGFLGQNGAGKSTTIRAVLGLIKYQEGTIRICGMDAACEHEKILKQIGYMPSETWFYPGMTIKEILRMAASVRNVDCSEESEKLCDILQLDVRRRISELSLGNRKKVSIVCAMQHRPKLLLFDEPTSGLDPLMQNKFFMLIHEYVKLGATCMLSTHVLSEVRNHCNKVGIMKEGKLLCVDTIEHLAGSTAKRVKMTRNGEKLDYLYKGNLNDFYKELQGYDIQDLWVGEPTIEELFMHYYGEKN